MTDYVLVDHHVLVKFAFRSEITSPDEMNKQVQRWEELVGAESARVAAQIFQALHRNERRCDRRGRSHQNQLFDGAYGRAGLQQQVLGVRASKHQRRI
jgi:hypothetical protein